MATSNRTLNNKMRETWIAKLTDWLTQNGEEVLRTNTGEIAIPCVDDEQNEKYITFTVKVPTGSRDGDAYDGHSIAEDFKMKQEEKAEKAKEAAEAKAKKIARDAETRRLKAEAKARREAERGE